MENLRQRSNTVRSRHCDDANRSVQGESPNCFPKDTNHSPPLFQPRSPSDLPLPLCCLSMPASSRFICPARLPHASGPLHPLFFFSLSHMPTPVHLILSIPSNLSPPFPPKISDSPRGTFAQFEHRLQFLVTGFVRFAPFLCCLHKCKHKDSRGKKEVKAGGRREGNEPFA